MYFIILYLLFGCYLTYRTEYDKRFNKYSTKLYVFGLFIYIVGAPIVLVLGILYVLYLSVKGGKE